MLSPARLSYRMSNVRAPYLGWHTAATLLLNQSCRTTRTGKIVVRGSHNTIFFSKKITTHFFEKILCCATFPQHNIFWKKMCCANHVQQFSEFMLFDMFDSKVVWPLCATVPTQAIEIFGNFSTQFRTLVIRELSIKILRRSSQGTPPFRGGVKPKRGSQI